MTREIAEQIQAEQEHGRTKYGSGPDYLQHDDGVPNEIWHECIDEHNERGMAATPMDRRQHLIKIAGLAVSAIESFERKQNNNYAQPIRP